MLYIGLFIFILGDFAFHGQNRAMSKNKHDFKFEDDSNSNGGSNSSFTSIFNNLVDSVYNFFKSLIDKIFNKNKK